MIYAFHPEAAAEYAEHVAFYKSLRSELGMRFHEAVKAVIASVCEMPARYRTEYPPAIRKARVQGFPHNVIIREVEGSIQILAVAHHIWHVCLNECLFFCNLALGCVAKSNERITNKDRLCEQSEPQSYPVVGQARRSSGSLIDKQISFWGEREIRTLADAPFS